MSEKRVLLVDATGNPILTAPLQLDDTDKLATSMYLKGSVAGDTPVLAQNSSYGNVRVSIYEGGNRAGLQSLNADAISGATIALGIFSAQEMCNGVGWDRQRNNEELVLLASAARTAQTDSADQINYNGSGLIVIVDVTVDPAAAAITPKLQIKDSISSNYFTVWSAAAAINAVGTYAYLFAPGGAAGSYTEAVNLRVARTWRVRIDPADADSMTYSVSAVVLV